MPRRPAAPSRPPVTAAQLAAVFAPLAGLERLRLRAELDAIIASAPPPPPPWAGTLPAVLTCPECGSTACDAHQPAPHYTPNCRCRACGSQGRPLDFTAGGGAPGTTASAG